MGSVALIALSSQKSSEREDAAAALGKALKQELSLQSAVPYPNAENLEAKRSNVEIYAESAAKLQESFEAYRPTAEELADVAPTDFSKMVGDYRSRLNEKFEASGTKVPAGAYYGFEAYSNKLPRAKATGELHYQMQALEWMFSVLAENSPEALINVNRPQMAIESNAVAAPVKSKSKKKSKNKNKNKKAATSKGETIYDAMPLELSFRCTEAQLKNFLADVANSAKYDLAVRAIRIQNERLTPPNDGDVKCSSNDVGSVDAQSGFADFVVEESAVDTAAEVVDELPSVASDSDDELLLAQVLGAEKLNVFIKIDLLVFKPDADQSSLQKGSNN